MLTARDFRRAAEQRFTTAEFLLDEGFTLDALYLAGYSVECILKGLIMHLTGPADQPSTFDRLKSGAKMHYPEHLQAELKGLGRPIPPEMIKRFRRFEWRRVCATSRVDVPAGKYGAT
jgi:HEPN domain-containing protein